MTESLDENPYAPASARLHDPAGPGLPTRAARVGMTFVSAGVGALPLTLLVVLLFGRSPDSVAAIPMAIVMLLMVAAPFWLLVLLPIAVFADPRGGWSKPLQLAVLGGMLGVFGSLLFAAHPVSLLLGSIQGALSTLVYSFWNRRCLRLEG